MSSAESASRGAASRERFADGGELRGATVDGLELFGVDGQAQELARARAQRSQYEVGRRVARGADDRRVRAVAREALDEAQFVFGRRTEGDDDSRRAQALDFRKDLLGVVAPGENARALLRRERAAQFAEGFESRAQNDEGELLSHRLSSLFLISSLVSYRRRFFFQSSFTDILR